LFGPVPAKYRFMVWLCGLAAFAGLGAWLSSAVPVSAPVMASVGLSLGALAVVIFLHDFEHPEHAHVRERRRHP